jgi:hypothetical protein
MCRIVVPEAVFTIYDMCVICCVYIYSSRVVNVHTCPLGGLFCEVIFIYYTRVVNGLQIYYMCVVSSEKSCLFTTVFHIYYTHVVNLSHSPIYYTPVVND